VSDSGRDLPAGSGRARWRDENWLLGGLAGIAAVTIATLALTTAGFLIALVVSLAF
jgi:hypothetical protein